MNIFTNIKLPLRAIVISLAIATTMQANAETPREDYSKGELAAGKEATDASSGTCFWYDIAKYTSWRDAVVKNYGQKKCYEQADFGSRGRPAWVRVSNVEKETMATIYEKGRG